MKVSSQPPHSKRQDARHRMPRHLPHHLPHPTRRRWGLALLTGVLALLLALTLQLCMFPGSGVVYGAPNAPQDASPTDTPSPTATTAAIPPTLTLAVPSSGQGPVNAHITITGSNWGTNDVLVGAADPGVPCANQSGWSQIFGHVRPQAGQTIVFTFDWPPILRTTDGAYSVCAANSAGAASAVYQVATAEPPSLNVDPLTTNAGSLVKVTGASFVGSGDVTLSVTDAQNKTRTLTTLSPDATGSFSLTFQPRPTDVGDLVLHAATSAPQGMRPAIQADAKLHVGEALTPTPGATPTVAVAPVTPPSSGNNTTAVLIVALVIAFLLAALAVGGAIFFFVMRNRKRPDDGTGYQPAYGGGPGYGMTGAYGARYQDEGYTGYGAGMGGMGGMGGTGVGSWDATMESPYAPPPDYGAEAPGWAPSDGPDPNWRPRPMTGQWRAPEGYGDAPYDSYGNYGPEDSGRYPPEDPWGAPDASYRQPGQPYSAGQRPSGSRGGYDPGYPDAPPQSPPGSNDWGGPGGAPRSGRYPPSGPSNRGSGGGSRGSSGGNGGRGSSGGSGASGGSAGDWFPDRRPDDDW